MMPAREDISDLRAGVRFWLFLNVWIADVAMGICHYAFIRYIRNYANQPLLLITSIALAV